MDNFTKADGDFIDAVDNFLVKNLIEMMEWVKVKHSQEKNRLSEGMRECHPHSIILGRLQFGLNIILADREIKEKLNG